MVVTHDGKPDTVLLPERRNYWVQQQSLAEAALGVSWRRDLLVTLGESLGDGAWSLRLQVRPADALRVARRRADGAGRIARDAGQALSHGGAWHRSGRPARCSGAAGMNRFAIPLVVFGAAGGRVRAWR